MPVVKITKIGLQHAILLSSEMVALLDVKENDNLYISETPHGEFRVTPVDSLTAEHLKSADKIMDEYRDELEKMAK